jgi:hypothetical protein
MLLPALRPVAILAVLFSRCAAAAESGRPNADISLPVRASNPHDEARDKPVEFYGHLNKAILVFDDGVSALGYLAVDNDNSASRFGVRMSGSLSDAWSVGGNLELEWDQSSTGNVNQLNHGDYGLGRLLYRKAEVYLNSKQFGALWLGQGSMASDTTAEVDFAGTSVAASSDVADMAAGSFFRLADGTLSSVRVKDAFSNYDGLGRKFRVRYDTPSLDGLRLSASVGTQIVPEETGVTVWDVAARYETTIASVKFGAAVAISRPSDDEFRYDASASFLHTPTGLSLTVATGLSDRTEPQGRYAYLKIGYQAALFEVGKTAVSVDAYLGEEIAGIGTDSHSLGAQIVQYLDDPKTELYVGARSYHHGAEDQDFKASLAFIAGAKVKF